MADWTVGPDGRSNTSQAFDDAVAVVATLLRNHRLGSDVAETARLIVAQLAHNYGFAPTTSAGVDAGERIRLARSLRGKFVRFNSESKVSRGYLVTHVTGDGLIEIQGWTGQFAPHLFERVDHPHSAAEGNS